ncbi:MAG: hypothetical protein IJW20_05630 [Clostridia bacterium]|nr:hypothetical protein [Clostridia bacterium]
MLESINIIKNTFMEYRGTGGFITLYLIALIYLFFKEENKEKRMFFIYFQFLILLVVLNPIFNKIVGKIFKASVYWRVYWTIPLGITIAYTAVKIISELNQEKIKKVILSITFIFIIMISGKFIYTEANYQKVGNLYKVPDESILVTQLISADNEEYKKAIVPENLVAYIRQIDSSIELAYKREPTGYENHPIVTPLRLGDTEWIANAAKDNNCNYIVVDKNIPLSLDFSYFGFNALAETPKYVIYKIVDETVEK